MRVGDVVVGRFPPQSCLRTAEVVSVEGDRAGVETMDGEQHERRVWSLRVLGASRRGVRGDARARRATLIRRVFSHGVTEVEVVW